MLHQASIVKKEYSEFRIKIETQLKLPLSCVEIERNNNSGSSFACNLIHQAAS